MRIWYSLFLFCQWDLNKKGSIRYIFKNPEKCLCEDEVLSFVLPAVEEK